MYIFTTVYCVGFMLIHDGCRWSKDQGHSSEYHGARWHHFGVIIPKLPAFQHHTGHGQEMVYCLEMVSRSGVPPEGDVRYDVLTDYSFNISPTSPFLYVLA